VRHEKIVRHKNPSFSMKTGNTPATLSCIATLNKEASLKTGTEHYNNKTAITEARIFKASSVMARNLQENYNTV
jgi:hypothetical protein